MTSTKSILLVTLCTIIIASAQLTLKAAVSASSQQTTKFLLLAGGVILYCSAGILLLVALRTGELSVLYPIIALGFVWVSIGSALWLGEHIPPMRIVGTVFIVFGVSLIGHQARRAARKRLA